MVELLEATPYHDEADRQLEVLKNKDSNSEDIFCAQSYLSCSHPTCQRRQGMNGANLRKCSRCRSALYCSKECQKT